MPLRAIDTNLIVALHFLLQERSVTRAAKRMRLGQSAMSHALARLRAHFGDPLLVPAGRSLVLSERAQALIEPVETAVTQLERVFAERPGFDPRTSERLFRIVGTDNLELYLVPRLAALLAEEAPGVLVRFHHLRDDWVSALQRGDADLKLGRKYGLPAGLRSQDLVEERLVCVVRKGHPLARKRNPVTLADYAAHRHLAITPTLGLGDTFSSPVDAHLTRHGLRRQVALTVSHFLVAPFVVATSDLLLTASDRLVATFEPSLPLVRIELPMKLPTYTLAQVWTDRHDADEGHRWLRDLVTRALRLSEDH